MYNVIFPCIMMSALTLLVFCLPPDSGEKIALGITVLLAFSVFMLAVAENLPETSEFVPLISIYLTIVMALTSMSVIMTVFVLNLHHRGPNRRPVPFWLKHVLLDKMAPYLCLHDNVPERHFRSEEKLLKNVSMKLTLDNIQQALQNEAKLEATRNNMANQEVPRGDKSTTSPVSEQDSQQNHVHIKVESQTNITNELTECSNNTPTTHVYPNVEIFRQIETSTGNHNSVSQQPVSIQCYSAGNTHPLTGQPRDSDSPSRAQLQSWEPHPNKTNQTSNHGVPRRHVVYHPLKTASVMPSQSGPNDSCKRQNRRSNSALSKTNEEILSSLKRILEKHQREDRDYEVVQEWRKIAQSVDRILFFIFLVATVSSTIGVLVIAPVLQ